MPESLYFISGFFLGGLLIFFIMFRQQKSAEKFIEELMTKTQEKKNLELQQIHQNLKDAFGALSMEALSKNTDEFIKLANKSFDDQGKINEEKLHNKKDLIDQTLQTMKKELQKVEEVVQKVESERKQSFGALNQQIKYSIDQTKQLQQTTAELNTTLSSSQARGQWGERMAEDVLKMAGFIEGINYLKQKSGAETTHRPDFTFLLPQDLKVNMDVKFPLSNYLGYLNSTNDSEKSNYQKQFLRDVRNRIKEVCGKDYINPADNTVDYVIVFIPNEQVYSFINESDANILDEALYQKVILCSPVTLYAVLAVIRQAVDNFKLEKTAAQILSLLSEFNKQWDKFKAGMDKMGRRIEDTRKEFIDLVSTRSRALEQPLAKIEQIRTQGKLSSPIE